MSEQDKRSFYKLFIENITADKVVGFKIKSTNTKRYMVSPTQYILNPKEKVVVDIVMHIDEQENVNINNIHDKFAIFYLDFSNFSENKDSIESFINNNKDK